MNHGTKENKYTHIGSSTTDGATVYDEGKFLYSYHATDPAKETLCNAFDLVRIHKFGHLDVNIKPHTRADKYPSYVEMCDYALSLPKVDKLKKETALEEFSKNPDAKLDDLFYKNGKFNKEEFCRHLIDEEHVCNIDNRLHIYDEGIYSNNEKLIHLKMIKLLTHTSKTMRNECVDYLDNALTKSRKNPDIDYIAFKNGLFNLKTKQLEEFNPEIIVTNLIPHDYNPDAYNELVDNVFNKITCGDQEIRSLLEEMIGYTFYRNNIYAKSFFLIGINSNNGKSVFLNLLKKVLGNDNFSAVAYEDLGKRFVAAELAGKLANIGDDCAKTFNSGSAIFKKLSTGETITTEGKGKDFFKFNNYAKLIFSFNELPKTDDKSKATARKRMCIIPFDAEFKETDPDFDPNINEKLQKEECIEYVIKLGVIGLQRLIRNKGFTKARAVEKEADSYEMYNNTILQFLKEKEDDENFKMEDYTPSQIYQQYKIWCENNGFDKAVNSTSFGMELKRIGYENKPYRLEGKLVRHYVKKSL